ncbi:T0001544 isoform 2, partial [Pan troglodytes]
MAKRLQAELSCPVCLDFFSSSISLSCSHVFCFDCIQRHMLENRDFRAMCPLCRDVVKVPALEEWQVSVLT